MKFAKELDENATPEWKSKYLDYKTAKKKLKAVTKAIREVDSRSPDSSRRPDFTSPFTSLRDAPVKNLLRRSPLANGDSQTSSAALRPVRSRSEAPSPQWTLNGESNPGDQTPRARPVDIHERSPLRVGRNDRTPHMTRYGSIIGSPPKDDGAELRPASTLELPMPSLDPEVSKNEQRRDQMPTVDTHNDPDYDRPVSPNDESALSRAPSDAPKPPSGQMQHLGSAYDPSTRPTDVKRTSTIGSRYSDYLKRRMPQRATSTPSGRPFPNRLFSFAGPRNPVNWQPGQDIALEAYRELDYRKAEFFNFLDSELSKIETFYKEEEDRAIERLRLVRAQMHTFREHRLRDVKLAEAKKARMRHLSTVANVVDKVGETSRSMAQLGTPSFASIAPGEPGSTAQQDYVHRVPYRTAKRQLKDALQELYRGLELLKKYSLLNRTAFRKILKKYGKSIGDLDPQDGRQTNYMSEKVNPAYFNKSEEPDKLIQTIEDLYARYFERGNHKLAVGKLRAKAVKATDFGGPMFRTGLLLGIGVVFGLQGLVYAALLYYDAPDGSTLRTDTSYLLQLYAGYFLFLALFTFFVLDAWLFENFHVNYPFIFELNSRNMVNWRRISELPAAFACLLGVCMWFNFNFVDSLPQMYIYWPVILIGLAVITLFAPLPGFFYADSRKWFLESLWRLLLAGIYPVEFRDFFLGDMFCSQTYAMGNIELFFCLYAHDWRNPGQCNSTSSRLLGFFSTLPGIWRALQCMRRYYDTHNAYPHLANMAKYGLTISQYLTLSLWRLDEHNDALKALFITSASLNSLYCIFWDIANDWSLSLPGLRPTLAFRKHQWWYYVASVEDAVLRFLWLGYVIFPHSYQNQHSSLISFMIAFLEVCRRGVWVIFRVENEHCTNVRRYKATRQTDLPYPEQITAENAAGIENDPIPAIDGTGDAVTTSSQLEDQQPSGTLSFRRRQGAVDSPITNALKRVQSTVLAAHSQDYERKRPTAVKEGDSEDDDDDDESDGE